MAERGRSEKTPRFRLVRRRRPLEVDDVLVVEPSSIRTAVRGTVVGNFMEWFDFGVYGYMAITLANLFFATGNENLDLLLSLLGFSVSFLVRPLGGLVLGPIGDRVGRQKVLFVTMATMATVTALIGVLPTQAQIGIWAGLLLYLLKMIQGFSTGGEYAGASTYVAEFSSDKRRGYFSSWLDVGSYVGFATGAATVALTHTVVSAGWGVDAFDDWGWRIPFLVAIPLGAVAIYFRTRIPETPAFELAEAAKDQTSGADGEAADAKNAADATGTADGDQGEEDSLAGSGLRNLLRHHWRAVLIAIAIVAAGNTVGYTLTSYMPTFLGAELGFDDMTSAIATIPAMIAVALSLPFIGRLSDRIGRKRVLHLAVLATLVLSIPAFLILLSGGFWMIQLAMFLLAIPTALYLAMFASTLPAMFPTAVRYAGMGIAFNVAVSAFGGTTPLISQALIDVTGNALMPAFWIMFFSLVCAVAMRGLQETAQVPLLGSFPTVEEPEEAVALVEDQDNDPHLDLETMPLEEELVRIQVDATGTPVEGIEPVPVSELSDADRALLDLTEATPDGDDQREQGAGERQAPPRPDTAG